MAGKVFAPRKLLVIHAHPDDESLFTGHIIPHVLDSGSEVRVLTLTRGERGQTAVDSLVDLNGSLRAMGSYREGELANALTELGVTDHDYLGVRAYMDSGMRINAWGKVGKPRPLDEMALSAAGTTVVGEDIYAEIKRYRPDAVLTYNPAGGYGHADHRATHQATAWALRRLAKNGIKPMFWVIADPDERADVEIGDELTLPRKRAALESHRSQVEVFGDEIVYNGKTRMRLSDKERIRRSKPSPLIGLRPALTYFWAIPLGGLVAIAGTLLHRSTDATGFPLGLVVALAMVTSLAISLRLLRNSRGALYLMAFSFALGIFWLGQQQPGGEIFISTNLDGSFLDSVGNLWAYGSIVLVALVMMFPSMRSSAWSAAASGKK